MRVRLFLEAFGVRAAVLNAELPLNSRHHILQVWCDIHDIMWGLPESSCPVRGMLRLRCCAWQGRGSATLV